MRKLMWFAIGFAAACAACAYTLMEFWFLPAVVIAAAAASVGAVVISKRRKLVFPTIAMLTGCVLGIFWFCAFYAGYIHPVVSLDGQQADMTITASDYSRMTEYGTVVDGTAQIEGKSYQLWVSLSEPMELQPGDTISAPFRIRLTTPGGLRESSVFQGKGIFLVADQRGDAAVYRSETVEKRYYPAILAERIKNRLEYLFPDDVTPFTKALLLGDTRDLDPNLDTAFKISGIRHVIAVSGLHISILYGLVCMITLKNRFLTAFVGVPVLVLFACMAGFTPSAVRACIMVCLMMLAGISEREYDPPTALSFAVLVILVMNPMAAMSVSLQLSAGSVAGILLFSSSINNWLKERLPQKKGKMKRLCGMLCSGISVTLSAMSLTTPLCAFYFGLVSLVSPLTNLLTLWAVTLIFIGLMVTILLWLIFPAAASLLAWVLTWLIRYVQKVSLQLASVPLAAVYTRSAYIVFWLLFVYLMLAVFLWMKKKQPGILLCCIVIGLCVALLASWAEPLMANTQITMLDVGQGQAIILHSEGKTFLVDCGGDDDEQTADLIAGTLLSQGISRLNGIIITHFDRDHSGALNHLLARMETDILFLPDIQNDFTPVEFSGEIVYVWEDLEIFFGKNKLQIFGPVYSGYDNENSLCVLFDTDKCDILITGDRSSFGERMLLRNSILPDVDILVAGHHGAADSTSEALLQAVTPETVLISVAENNYYNHPSPALLYRLERYGCSVYRTDRNGTIIIRR